MKFLKKLSDQNAKQQLNLNFSDRDIDVLAVMAEKCLPIVKKGIFSRKTYSYYVLVDEVNVEIAHDLFADNGINMEYRVYEDNGYVRRLLRVKHDNPYQSAQIIEIMHKIEKRKHELNREMFFGKGKDKTWWQIQDYIIDLKERKEYT